MVTPKLICVFVFAYAKIRFSQEAAHLVLHLVVQSHVIIELLVNLSNMFYVYSIPNDFSNAYTFIFVLQSHVIIELLVNLSNMFYMYSIPNDFSNAYTFIFVFS